jgi:hypothetical protein
VAIAVSTSDLNRISQLQSELVLGIILSDGRVQFRIADSQLYPGHAEWLNRDGIPRRNVSAGFSLLIKHGRVQWLFALSRMNKTPTSCLTDQQILELTSVLPLEAGFQVFK